MSASDEWRGEGLTPRQRLELWMAGFFFRHPDHHRCAGYLSYLENGRQGASLKLRDAVKDGGAVELLQAVNDWAEWDRRATTRH